VELIIIKKLVKMRLNLFCKVYNNQYLNKMNKQFSFSKDEMNGIVEDTYRNIITECKNLIKETQCPNEQIIALLSLVASTFTPTISKE
tara:strand:- start:491 stop:754 length:264 start_codon:yes stop_codon:yes gene_type:complete